MAGAAWTPEGLPQPDPAFLPALHRATRGGVRIVSMRADRIDLTVRAGAVEPATGTGDAPPARLDRAAASRVLVALGAGRTAGAPSGLVIGRRVYWGLHEGDPALVRTESGAIAIGAWPVADAVEAVQGRWLSRAENRPGAPPAAAVALTADGRLLYADGAPEGALADALGAAGATVAMRLFRGAPAPALFDVAGQGLRDGYDQAAIYVLGGAPRPNVFRMDGARAALAINR
jgi:hypothetical protein